MRLLLSVQRVALLAGMHGLQIAQVSSLFVEVCCSASVFEADTLVQRY